MRRLVCISFAAAALWFVSAAPASANPYMSWGQWTSGQGTPFSQCWNNAPRALAAVGLSSTQNGRYFYGANGVFSVSIICYDLGNAFIVTIVVAQDRGTQPNMTTDQVRDQIQSVIFATGAATPPPAAAPPGGSGWDANAVNLRGRNGQRFTFTCEPNGHLASVWGTDIYTDDSRVCSAAVHSGLINTTNGGTVTIEIRPGQASYTASQRYGVSSGSWGSWSGSFVFVP